MSVGTIRIQLPSRACWWIKALAKESNVSVDYFLRVMVLRELANLPGVDLSRNPDSGTRERSLTTKEGL